jgi:hypothetical protein
LFLLIGVVYCPSHKLFHSFTLLFTCFITVSIHRCTRVENPGEGVRNVFAKIPRRGQGFQEKLLGGSTYFAFYCIFINKFFENLPGGCCFIPPPPPLPPLCASMFPSICYVHYLISYTFCLCKK